MLVVLIIFYLQTSSAFDKCHDYHRLDRATRKIDFDDKNNVYNCDYRLSYYCSLDWKGPGWYRVVDHAGTMLAESSLGPHMNQCGTSYGGWLRNGTHQNITNGQVGDATVCYTGFQGDKCMMKSQIKIKNCGDFFVYRLPGVFMNDCNAGYCTM